MLKLTKTVLLNVLALVLLPHGVAMGQSTVVNPSALPAHEVANKVSVAQSFELTELQKARLDAARQEVFRWQDKMQEALQKFSAICSEAKKENHWPEVQCGLNDLKVTSVPKPAPALPAKPADK